MKKIHGTDNPIFSMLLGVMLLSNANSHADSSFKFHAGVGAGLRYAGATFPFPLINMNKNIGESTIFIEGALSPAIILGSIGYAHKISNRYSFKVSAIKVGTISESFSGYRLGYVYNSNVFNGNGWETSLELYSISRRNTTLDSNDVKSRSLFPSVSFGYIW